MSDLKEYLENHDSLKKYADALGTAEKVVGIATGVYGYYSTVKGIGEALGLWGGGPSEMDRLAQAIEDLAKSIQDAFNELKVKLHAEFDLEEGRDLAGVISPVRSAINSLALYRDDPEKLDLAGVLRDTDTALQTLRQGAWWQGTYYAQLAYRDPWTGVVEPPGAGATRFDYVLGLPVFMEAIASRIVVLRMLDADNLTEHRDEMNGHADFLGDLYFKIRNGISTLRMPTVDEVQFEVTPLPLPFNADPLLPINAVQLSVSKWERAGWVATSRHEGLFGAFNVWSTESSMDAYPQKPPRPTGAYDALYGHWRMDVEKLPAFREEVRNWYEAEVVPFHTLRSMRHWKALYAAAGLRNIWAVRNGLLTLAGEPVEPVPGTSDIWSLREILEAIPAHVRPHSSVAAMAGMLKTNASMMAMAAV